MPAAPPARVSGACGKAPRRAVHMCGRRRRDAGPSMRGSARSGRPGRLRLCIRRGRGDRPNADGTDCSDLVSPILCPGPSIAMRSDQSRGRNNRRSAPLADVRVPDRDFAFDRDLLPTPSLRTMKGVRYRAEVAVCAGRRGLRSRWSSSVLAASILPRILVIVLSMESERDRR